MMQGYQKQSRYVGFVVLMLCSSMVGCVAQQADVARIKRNLNQKIAKLDTSRTDLESAVNKANLALEKTNSIIAQQRVELKSLVRARADILDQVTMLRDGDLSQVRGDIDKSLHGIHQVSDDTKKLQGSLQNLQGVVRAQEENVQSDIQILKAEINKQLTTLHAQKEKDQEFQKSLVEFKSVMSQLEEKISSQEGTLQASTQEWDSQLKMSSQASTQTMEYLKNIEKSVSSVVTTLDKVNADLSHQIDQQGQQLSHLSKTFQVRKKVREVSKSNQNEKILELSSSLREIRRALDVVVESIGARVDAHEEQLTRIRGQVSPLSNIQSSSVIPFQESHERLLADVSKAPFSAQKHLPSPAEIEYTKIQSLLQKQNFQEALVGFSDFLIQYPHAYLASNAQYWMGECYYATQKFEKAIEEFERVIGNFSESNKVPAALLKIGYSHLALQDREMAKATFRQLVRTYPKSPEAAKATVKLTEVSRMLPTAS